MDKDCTYVTLKVWGIGPPNDVSDLNLIYKLLTFTSYFPQNLIPINMYMFSICIYRVVSTIQNM